MESKIVWTDYVWEVTSGCRKCAPGCENCYGIPMVGDRFANNPIFKGRYKGLVKDGNWTGRIELFENRLEQPMAWGGSKKIFVDPRSDLFYGDDADRAYCEKYKIPFEPVPFEFVDKVMAIIALYPQHTFQVLTKRPGRMLKYFKNTSIRESCILGALVQNPAYFSGVAILPLPNLHLGTSVSTQADANKNIPPLLQTPAAFRFVSAEPLIEGIDLRYLRLDDYYCPQCKTFFDEPGEWRSPCCGAIGNVQVEDTCEAICSECNKPFDSDREIPACPKCNNQGGGRYIQPDFSECFSGDLENVALQQLDQIIIGCESGPNRRPCDLEWVRDIVAQRKAAGVKAFVKQLPCGPDGKVTSDMSKFPADLRIREILE